MAHRFYINYSTVGFCISCEEEGTSSWGCSVAQAGAAGPVCEAHPACVACSF